MDDNSNGAVTELYRRHRPKRLCDVVGQDAAVRVLEEFLKRKQVPHAILFTGGSGVGKTTLARILARKLGCGKQDYAEVNCASCDPMATIRSIQSAVTLHPMSGPCRVWLLDEVQSLSRAGFAQQALLKILEDTPKHAYLFLCTTDPGKLIKTIHTRCTEVSLGSVTEPVLVQLVKTVAAAEQVQISDEIVNRIAEHADGSARKALVLLGQVLRLPGETEQLAALERGDSRRQAIDLCRALLNPSAKWPAIAAILKNLDDDPEQVRRAVLGYMSSVLLGGGRMANLAKACIDVMRDHLYDCGKPGLVANCWEIFGEAHKGGR